MSLEEFSHEAGFIRPFGMKACFEGLTSWLSFVMSNCEDITFPLVSWV